MRSDDDLLDAWRAGDQRAGKQLFTRHYAAIDRFFRNKVGDDCSDLAQKTFLGCLEAVDRYQNEHKFRSWLFAIAYRQLCKHYRERASERARLDFGTVTAHNLDPSPSLVIAQSQEQRLLLEALRQIPVDMQVALELHYWEQMSDAEIARTLELPLGTIKSRIRRGRILLNEQLTALSSSPEQLRSTLANLDDWAAQLRDAALRGLAAKSGGEGMV
ncbi:RNA polymerase sigma factor [Enhygromyxa salina]|uniref:ECF RNA polymerase sigma-E factor n=1 Tax=Enhygromyxa salina TaxID=215803 RepID=A0A2S9XR27_9BACT|nr:RNA polymerase sigma factor [Enhygromyxa salina]PRP95190.1 ECF RNA polymerase sigma-E factor [Enhygromyxa salina]